MSHPFESLSPNKRKRFFWLSLAGTLVLMVGLNMVGARLNTAAAPFGIVSYELAGNVPQAQAILASWDQDARLSAAFSLGLDYLFMLAYSTAIGLGCIWAAHALRQRGWPLASLGASLAWGQWLAALLDAVENLALTLILFGSLVSPWPEIARWCALVKFALVFLGMIYAFLGLVANLIGRLAPDV